MTINSLLELKNQILYWDLDLESIDSSYFAHFYHSISDQDKKRASLFAKENDRNLFITAHYALDSILKDVFHISPIILVDQYGKPFIKGHPIQFNISHTENRVLLGFSQNAIGIDIEKITALPDLDLLIEYSMHPDEIYFLNAQEPLHKLQLFYRLWTKKEALVKAMGIGLGKELSSFTLKSTLEDDSWNAYEISINDRYSAAIATQISCCSIVGYQLTLTPSGLGNKSLSRLIR
jgi:4'-phosphopantetheinyl transferase